MLSTGQLPLMEILTRVARYAVQAIPVAGGAGLTLIEQNGADTIVATASFVGQIDAVQYRLNEGPCISAARDGVTVISGSLGEDPRWPRFSPRVARMGAYSVVSLPLLTPDEVVDAMNVYAHHERVFDERAAELCAFFAVPAAAAVQNARVLEDTRRTTQRLQAVLDERVVVERAVGIIMSRTGVDAPEALARLARLTKLSQNEHVQLVQLARNLVDDAVRRARGR